LALFVMSNALGQAVAVAVVGVLALGAASAQAFDPAVEAQNFSKTLERQATYLEPATQLLLRKVSAQNQVAALAAQGQDPEREFVTDLCWNGADGCAGDPRLYDWKATGYGIVRPVLFTARNGATLSGHVWATKSGPPRRPGVVITNGSVQADEQMYWYAAQALAKAGYVVLTFDPQGQGQSDSGGEGADAGEGVPAQSDGRPFFDGTVDAIDFFLSTKGHPYEPRPSCTTGTSHAPKQDRRVAAGLNAAYDPYAAMVDPSRLGLAGHSYGAAGVSYVGQWDPRVRAIVAWDNLGRPSATDAGGPDGARLGEQPCPADPSQRTTPPITKPGLGISVDYGLPARPNTSDPDPEAKSAASHAYTAAAVDTGELIVRGGSHVDFSYIPNPAFGASLRGPDLAAWYTTAWFDKYVKGDARADARLLTERWRDDPLGAAVDARHDANDFSFYYRSRLDVHRAGGGPRVVCEDLRAGCAALGAADGVAGAFSYLATDTTPDGR
jgi:dienelactone hydrolase